MDHNLSYLAFNGRTVTLESLETTCAEIGHLLHGTILNLHTVAARHDLDDEQCARLTLILVGLRYLETRLGDILPIAENI